MDPLVRPFWVAVHVRLDEDRRTGPYCLTHLRRRWASSAVRETAWVLLYRRRFVGVRVDPR